MRDALKYDLKDLLQELVGEQPLIEEIYLFGSRAYRTGSLRSDCDLLIKASEIGNIKSYELTDFASFNCPALDFFVAEGGKAVSAANHSFVQAKTFEELVTKLDAILLWTRDGGFEQYPFNIESKWAFETAMTASFPMTMMPNAYLLEETWGKTLARAESAKLPTCPYIGDTIDKAVSQIIEVIQRMIISPGAVGKRGATRANWTVKLESEYDCQNLFWTVVRPWIAGLKDEEFTVRFDDQEKIVDFTLFDGQVVIEMKFIDTDNKKREVVKTLDGLQRFYQRNGNVRCLLFVIFYKEPVMIDIPLWEHDYTKLQHNPTVITRIFKVA